MRKFTFFMQMLGLTMIVLTSIAIAGAQDVPAACEPEELAAQIADRLANAPDNRQGILGLLRALASDIARMDAACSGLHFEGSGQKLLGPVVLPEGVYRLTASGDDGFGIVEFTMLDGECGEGNRMSPNVLSGDVTQDVEVVVVSAGCEVLIDANMDDNWELVFEQLR